MSDEVCLPCKQAGFANILAHYKGVSKGMSANGKEIPPMCFDHKHGRVPKHIQRVQPQLTQPPQPSIAVEAWIQTLQELSALPMKADRVVSLTESGKNANQIRASLRTNKLTLLFRWSVESESVDLVRVSKIGTWAEEDEKRLSENDEPTNESPDELPEPPEASKLAITVMSQQEYQDKYHFPVSCKGGAYTEEALLLWERILALDGKNVMLLEPPKDEDVLIFKKRISQPILRLQRLTAPPFRVRLSTNILLRHVLIWKVE
jgi:hypothetical protein